MLITASSLRKRTVKRSFYFFRLRQHNGELKGGAKAASAGRPWHLACLVEGFANISEG